MLKRIYQIERGPNGVHLLDHLPLVLEGLLRERVVRLDVDVLERVGQHEPERVQEHPRRGRVDLEAVRVIANDHVANLGTV